jgi:MSHA biogenesis protein MshP
MTRLRPHRRQRGFLLIAAVFLLVVLAGMVAYLMSVTTTTQAASASDFNAAYQAARTGIEWATYQILRDPGGGTFRSACTAGSASRNQTYGGNLAGFTTTVTCTAVGPLTEGASTTVYVYKIVANACNEPSGGACPVTTPSATYVDRELSVTLTN